MQNTDQNTHTPVSFSALENKVSAHDIDEYLKTLGSRIGFRRLILTILSVGYLAVMIVVLVVDFDVALQQFGLISLIYLLLSPLVVYLIRGRYVKSTKMWKFAKANGFTYTTSGGGPKTRALLFNTGVYPIAQDTFTLPDNTYIGNYAYQLGDDPQHRSIHRYAYIRILLPRQLPHMILDAKSNDTAGFVSSLNTNFDRSQTLSLEAGFDNHFTLYAPKNYETDALYIFTPDVMAAFVDFAKDYDAEIIDNELFLYHRGHLALHKPEEQRHIMYLVDVLRSEIGKQAQNYRDSNAQAANVYGTVPAASAEQNANQTPTAIQPSITQSSAASVTGTAIHTQNYTPQNLLKKKALGLNLRAFTFIGIILISLAIGFFGMGEGVAVFVIVVIVLAWLIVKRINRKKFLKKRTTNYHHKDWHS